MKSHFTIALLVGVALFMPGRSGADQIACQGVIGNSGEEGSTLVRFGQSSATGMGIVYDAPTGSIWSRAGDGVLNRYALDGRLLATYPLAKQASPTYHEDKLTRVGDRLIMTVGDQLYALPIDAPSGTSPTALKLKADLISFGSFNGSIAIANTLDRKTWQIVLYNVETGASSPLINSPLTNVRQVELLPSGDLVVHIPGTTLGDYHVSGIHELHLFRNGVEVTDGWPRPSPGDHMAFIDGYWFGAMGHGTLHRFNANLEPDPGVVLGGGSGAFIGHVDTNEEVGDPYGPVKIHDGLYAVSGSAGIVHLLAWDKSRQQFTIVRRIGAVQTCHGIALNRQGDVWYNAGLWRWNDPPDTPWSNGSSGLEMGQAVMLPNDHFTAPILRYGIIPAIMGGNFDWNIALNNDITEKPGKAPFFAGSAVYKDAKGTLTLLIIDSEGNSRTYRVDAYTGRDIDVRGSIELETATPVKEWTSLAMKDPDTLLGAADGYVVEMVRDGINWKETRRWNTEPDGTLGSRIYLTTDAGRLWISDTDNNQVLCFHLTDDSFVAAFGTKGQPGDDLSHLFSPRVIEARDNRAIVFDSGNQRLVKLLVGE